MDGSEAVVMVIGVFRLRCDWYLHRRPPTQNRFASASCSPKSYLIVAIDCLALWFSKLSVPNNMPTARVTELRAATPYVEASK